MANNTRKTAKTTRKPTTRKPSPSKPKERRDVAGAQKKSRSANLTLAQKELLKNELSRLYVDGYGVYQMQQYLKDREILSVSIPTIYKHIDLVLEDWHRENVDNVDKQISGELMKLSRAEQEYWDAWTRSKGSVVNKTVRRVGRPKGGKREEGNNPDELKTYEVEDTTKTIELIGDVRFLEGYERCITKRIEILQRGGFQFGGDASPNAVYNTMNQTVINVGVVNPNETKPIKATG